MNSKRNRDYAHSICAARPFLLLNLKGTPSQEENKTIICNSKINAMALSDQIDFPAFLRLCKMTYWNFIYSGIRQSAAAFDP
jgi:hypothetical protein